VPGIVEGGLAFRALSEIFRAGGSVDGDLDLGSHARLLYGVEAFHEWVDENTERSRGGPGIEATFLSPYDLAKLPFACPSTGVWDPAARVPVQTQLVAGCPVTVVFQVSRTTLGGFTSLQLRPTSRLILDGGVRLQAAPTLSARSRGYGLTPTFSATAVVELATDWHVKLNYAEGFRPPVFNNTDANGEAVNIGGSPTLRVETSRAAQAEINARLLKGRGAIRELDLRADYSYTTLDDYIAFIAGRYANTGERGIHSAELLAKLYLKGGHRVELGYTFNRIDMSDKGTFHAMPNHWLSLSAVHLLAGARLELATVLRVYGAFEDPNRRVEARGLAADPTTGASYPGDPTQSVAVQPYETVIDRAPPAAELQVGFRWHTRDDRWRLQATAYNAFANQRNAYDNSDDLEPRLEIVPSNFEARRVFVSATHVF
jgi:outer membrane receptor protein involved in Fe transport